MCRAIASLSLLIAAPAWAALPAGTDQINDAEWITQINQENADPEHPMTWTAGQNAFFAGKTFDEVRPFLGTALSDISEHLNETLPESAYDRSTAIPSEFDSSKQWPGLIHPIRDQQKCGSCWAFSAAEVLSDRTSIVSGKQTPVLSPEDMVSCDKSDMGCNGGRLSTAWSYIKNNGIVSDACFPYTAGGGKAATCSKQCSDSESWSASKVKASSVYAISGVENMQREIMTKGPIQVAFTVYKSFMSYKTGVYQKLWYEVLPEGGHAVKIVGWGTESGVDYWLVANSWNTTWGLDGFFKIRRGNNACGIEKSGPPYAGVPAVETLVV